MDCIADDTTRVECSPVSLCVNFISTVAGFLHTESAPLQYSSTDYNCDILGLGIWGMNHNLFNELIVFSLK